MKGVPVRYQAITQANGDSSTGPQKTWSSRNWESTNVLINNKMLLITIHCRYTVRHRSDLLGINDTLICTISHLRTSALSTLQDWYIQIKLWLKYIAMVAFMNLIIDDFNISKLYAEALFLLRLLIIHADEIVKHILFESRHLQDLAQCRSARVLIHWGRVTHICFGKLTIMVSDSGVSTGRHQAIIWPNAEKLSIRLSATNFSEMLIGNQTFSFKKCTWKCRLQNSVHFVSG